MISTEPVEKCFKKDGELDCTWKGGDIIVKKSYFPQKEIGWITGTFTVTITGYWGFFLRVWIPIFCNGFMRQLLAPCGCIWLKTSWSFIPKSFSLMLGGANCMGQMFWMSKSLRWNVSRPFPLPWAWKSFGGTDTLHNSTWITGSSPVALRHANSCLFKDGCGKAETEWSSKAAAWVCLATSRTNFIWGSLKLIFFL